MKKILLFAMGALMALPSGAQEVDVTSYIHNAGFDVDLTFQADGSKKEIVDSTTSLSNRSWALVAADNSVYAKPTTTSSQNRSDGLKMKATNGFIGQVSGWTVETNQTFPQCEWVYFGTIPYALGNKAIPIADDGNTYLEVPNKPAVDSGEDNLGFVYMRAGWGGRAVYKQTVKLPCAKYRLEYWAINTNPSGTNGKNLSKVVCRRDTWADQTGFSDTEWTKHTIEFTPISEFTMQFGFESSGSSGSNPFLCIDGIKLYKIGEADPLELAKSDLLDVAEDLRGKAEELTDKELSDLAAIFQTAASDAESQAEGNNVDNMVAQYNTYMAMLEAVETNLAMAEQLQAMSEQMETLGCPSFEAQLQTAAAELTAQAASISEDTKTYYAECEALLQTANEVTAIMPGIIRALMHMEYRLAQTDYPGKEEAQAAYNRISGYLDNGTVDQIRAITDEINSALIAYANSQNASAETPADFTICINHPWFINENLEPTLEEGKWVFPNADNYVAGENNNDLTREGWVMWRNSWNAGYDLRTNWQQGRSCYNAWMSCDTTYKVAIVHYFYNLPEGYYSVSADMITQDGCASNQHVFASTVGDYSLSDDYPSVKSDSLTVGNYIQDGEGEWTTLTTPNIHVGADGVLTFGAEGKHIQGDENLSAGWFLVTNFRLTYYGKFDPRYKPIAGTVEDPTDLTSELQNPSFENNSYEGWQGTPFGGYNPVENAEHYAKNYTTYQTLDKMPPGVYAATVNAFYRDGSAQRAWESHLNNSSSHLAKLYAGAENAQAERGIKSIAEGAISKENFTSTDSLNGGWVVVKNPVTEEETYLPDNMAAAEYLMHEKGQYMNSLVFDFEGGQLYLGVKKAAMYNNDWSIFDDFGLTYFGQGDDAYQLLFEDFVANAPQFNINNVTTSYLDAYNQALEDYASTKEDVLAAIKNIEALADTLQTNLYLWYDLQALVDEAYGLIGEDSKIDASAKTELADYISAVEARCSVKTLTNQELREEMADLQQAMDKAKEKVSVGTDVTDLYLKNADYESGSAYWQGSPVMGSGGGNTCAEAYGRANFDIYQEVTGAAVGVYAIEVQGFFRLGRPQHERSNTNSWAIWEEGKQKAPAFVYLNDNKTALKCIYEEGVMDGILEDLGNGEVVKYTQANIDSPDGTYQYPNTMQQAAEAFAYGMYKSTAYGLIAKEGDPLRIGVKGSLDAASAGYTGANWAIWDNFKLTYLGFAADVVKPVLQDKYDEVVAEDLGSKIMTKSAYQTWTNTMEKTETNLQGEDGTMMFQLLDSLVIMQKEVEEAIALCQAFYNKMIEVYNLAHQYESQEVMDWAGDVLNKLTNKQLEKEDIEAYEAMIPAMKTKAVTPSSEGASEETPVDMTVLIQNPNYEKDGLNSLDGWTASAGFNFGIDGTQMSALALEYYNNTFNIYQDIVGLVNGVYEVRVNAFNRQGSLDSDYYAYESADENEAKLYLVSGDNEVSQDLQFLFNAALTEGDQLPDSFDEYTVGDGTEVVYYVPNSMVSFKQWCNNGYYLNSLRIRVENGELRLGIKKEANTQDSWAIMDSWRLYYLGTEASVVTGISEVQPVVNKTSNVYYTLSGVRVTKPVKGIYIVNGKKVVIGRK